jgi:exonuclease SbcC
MRVKIIGFKCHVDAEFSFPNNGVVLLNGPSGAGKSTILQAIYWCLFGNLRGVYNNTHATKKCSVTLVLDNMIIYRQKRPELFNITVGDKSYEDKVAQDIITQRFGDKEIWKACCYIEQKDRCTLLSGTNADRMEMLDQLSIYSEDPQICISQINDELKEVTKNFTEIQANFTAELNHYNSDLNTRPIVHECIAHIDKIDTLHDEIDLLMKERSSLQEQVLEQQRLIGIHSTLTLQIDKCQSQLSQFPIKTEVDINDCYQKISSHRDKIIDIDSSIANIKLIISEDQTKIREVESQIKELELKIRSVNSDIQMLESQDREMMIEIGKLESQGKDIMLQIQNNNQFEIKYNSMKDIHDKKIDELGLKFPGWEKYDTNNLQQLIWSTKRNEQERLKNIQECTKIRCEYTESSIGEILNKLQGQLVLLTDLEKKASTLKTLKNYEIQLQNLNIDENLLNKADELEGSARDDSNMISELKRGVDILKCPHCLKSVRYLNGNVVPGDREPVSQVDIQQAEHKYMQKIDLIKKIRGANQLSSQMKSLESLLDNVSRNEIEEFIKAPKDINSLRGFINVVSKIQYIAESEVKSELLDLLYEYQQIRHGMKPLDEHKSKLLPETTLRSTLSDISDRVKQIRQRNKSEEIKEKGKEKSYIMTEINKIREMNKIDISDKMSKITALERDKNNTTDSIGRIENEARQIGTIISQRQALAELLDSYKNQINQIDLKPEIGGMYKTCEETLSRKKQQVENVLYAKKMRECQEKLEIMREEVMRTNEDIVSLQRLKQNSMNTQCRQLEDAVNSINIAMLDTLSAFFTEPINVTLKVYKTVKAKKSEKPGVHLSIVYKGCEYDSVSQMSGGEGDRVSLALIVALNSISKSPILLLDECMTSFDVSLREQCVKVLGRKTDKIIICIDHGDIEGFYTRVINV